MNLALRRFVLSAALAAASFGLEVTNPGWIKEVGPALCSLHQARTTLECERRFRAQLRENDKMVLELISIKQQVILDLLAQHLTLWEAAARFRDLGEKLPAVNRDILRSVYPGSSDEERYCQQVIAAVEAALKDQPGKAAALAERLRAELQEQLECCGACCLPR